MPHSIQCTASLIIMTSIVSCRSARIRSRHGVTLILLCFTELIVAMVAQATFVWGGAIKIGARL